MVLSTLEGKQIRLWWKARMNRDTLIEILSNEYEAPKSPKFFEPRWRMGRGGVIVNNNAEPRMFWTLNGRGDALWIYVLDFGYHDPYENMKASLDYFFETCQDAHDADGVEKNFLYDVIVLAKDARVLYAYTTEAPYSLPPGSPDRKRTPRYTVYLERFSWPGYTKDFYIDGMGARSLQLRTPMPTQQPFLSLPQGILSLLTT